MKITLEAPHVHGMVNELKITLHALQYGIISPESRALTSEAAKERAVEMNPEAGKDAAPAPQPEKAPPAKAPAKKPAAKKAAPTKAEPEYERDEEEKEYSAPEVEEEIDPAFTEEAEEAEASDVTLEDVTNAFPKFVKSFQRAKDDELGRKKGLHAAKQILEEFGVPSVSKLAKKDWAEVYKRIQVDA